MAFLLELQGPPVCVLAQELTEERLGLLCKLWSELPASRLLFRDPGLGTKDVQTPFCTRGLNADGLVSGLFSLCSPSGKSGSCVLTLPFLHSLRALSTVSFAHGPGGFSEGEDSTELICAGDLEATPLCSGGEILMVTGLHGALGCRGDQILKFQ